MSSHSIPFPGIPFTTEIYSFSTGEDNSNQIEEIKNEMQIGNEKEKLQKRYDLLLREYNQILKILGPFQDQLSQEVYDAAYKKIEKFVKEHPEFQLPSKPKGAEDGHFIFF